MIAAVVAWLCASFSAAEQATLPPPPEELALLLEARQRDLDRREVAVQKDEERVRLLRQDMETLLKKQAKQAKAPSPAAGVSAMTYLSQAFETMPIEEAAQRLEKMNDGLAVDLLARLKSKTTGNMLAAIAPAKAARLVEKLAARQPGTGQSGAAQDAPGKGPSQGVTR